MLLVCDGDDRRESRRPGDAGARRQRRHRDDASRSAGVGRLVRLRRRRHRREGALPAGQRRRRRATAGRSTTPASPTTAATPPPAPPPRPGSCSRTRCSRSSPRSRPTSPPASSWRSRRCRTSAGRSRRTSAATTTGSGSPGAWCRRASTSNAWGVLISKVFGAQSAGRTAAIVTENTPSGQYDAQRAQCRRHERQVRRSSTTRPSLAVPATLDYGAVAKEVLASNAGKSPDAVFVVGNASNVLGMQQALGAAGFLGVFTNQIQYDPNLVAPAIGAIVLTQTAPTESAPTNPAMAPARDRRAEGGARPADRPVGASRATGRPTCSSPRCRRRARTSPRRRW